MNPFHLPRREFLRSCAVITVGSALPAWAAEEKTVPTKLKASDSLRPTVALIGCGGMGRHDARLATAFGDIVAICDVDSGRLDQGQKDYPKAARYTRFEDCLAHPGLDVVINATPDHWHTLINLAALKAKKDIYSEKPLTLTLGEGQHLTKAVTRSHRILQTGSQQRSDPRFRLAVELVRNGRIGTLKQVLSSLPAGPQGGPFTAGNPPPSLDWDRWQGQTAFIPYVRERCHGSFRYWWEYSAGTLTDWGAHHNDIARWGIGADGPISANAEILRPPVPGGYSVPSEYRVEYTYRGGVTHTCQTVSSEDPSGGVKGPTPAGQFPNGVRFVGTEGWIFVSRLKIEASAPEILQEPLQRTRYTAPVSDNHMGNFFACVASRKPPVAHAEIGHRSVSVCHIGAIAMRLGRPVRWDPVREQFPGDPEANALIHRPQRAPYTYASVS